MILFTLEVAPLQGKELEEAVRCWETMLAQGFTEDQGQIPNNACYGVFARDHAGKTIGIAVIHDVEEQDLAWLWLLYVEPQARGHGIGRQLLDASVKASWDLWEKPTGLGTQGFNITMQRLAAEAGFMQKAIFYVPKAPDNVGRASAVDCKDEAP
jgi:GNAT superfamily N-acetyltransferase